MNFAAMLELLNLAAATADAAARARILYEKIREANQQTHELTLEEEAALDARAAQIFSSEASKPSGR